MTKSTILLILFATTLLGGCGAESTSEQDAGGGPGFSEETVGQNSATTRDSPAVQPAGVAGLPTPRSEPEQTMLRLIQSFRKTTALLRTVRDEPTAKSAVPDLTSSIEEVRDLLRSAAEVSPAARAEVHPRFGRFLTVETEAFNREVGRILQTPGAAPPLFEALQMLPPDLK